VTPRLPEIGAFATDGRPVTRERRVYRPWTECEEFADGGGMWRIVTGPGRQGFIDAAGALMADPDAFRLSMRRALREWPNSVETALSAQGNNQRAWMGHAGCYLATGSPEETTRLGWHTLTDDQQRAANAAADDVIALWRIRRATTTGQLDLFDQETDVA
jgi:hypothetical protein